MRWPLLLGLLVASCDQPGTMNSNESPMPAASPRSAGARDTTSIVTATLYIEGMVCEGCAQALEQALGQTEGVQAVVTDHREATATVEFDPALTSIEQLTRAVEEEIDRDPAPPFRVTQTALSR